VFERPAVVPKTVHGFEHLIPALDGEMPDLHPLLGRVAEAARNEYTRLSDPLVAWRSESSLHGSISRLLRAVITPEAAERG
jgi:hypothetical protein